MVFEKAAEMGLLNGLPECEYRHRMSICVTRMLIGETRKYASHDPDLALVTAARKDASGIDLNSQNWENILEMQQDCLMKAILNCTWKEYPGESRPYSANQVRNKQSNTNPKETVQRALCVLLQCIHARAFQLGSSTLAEVVQSTYDVMSERTKRAKENIRTSAGRVIIYASVMFGAIKPAAGLGSSNAAETLLVSVPFSVLVGLLCAIVVLCGVCLLL